MTDTLYDLNNLWMLPEFIRQNRQVLFQEVQTGMNGQKRADFTETCRFGRDTILSRMFQVMENFRLNEKMVAQDSAYAVAAQRMKAYSFITKSGRSVPQIILQRNWVEHWDFKVEFSDSVECYSNKLFILKNKKYGETGSFVYCNWLEGCV